MNVYKHIEFDDSEEELKWMEENTMLGKVNKTMQNSALQGVSE